MESIEDQVAYLKNIDPASIDEDLEDIGVTPANIEAVVEGLEMIWGHASCSLRYPHIMDLLLQILKFCSIRKREGAACRVRRAREQSSAFHSYHCNP